MHYSNLTVILCILLFTAICPGTCFKSEFMSICEDDNCAKGECEDNNGVKTCSCYAGWTGETCETGTFDRMTFFRMHNLFEPLLPDYILAMYVYLMQRLFMLMTPLCLDCQCASS